MLHKQGVIVLTRGLDIATYSLLLFSFFENSPSASAAKSWKHLLEMVDVLGVKCLRADMKRGVF